MSDRENDLYYLESILRQLQELKEFIHSFKKGDLPSIGTEVLYDNIDWLDCYIDRLKK